MRRRLLVNNNLPIKPIEESLAADICLVKNNTLDKLIVEADDYNLETFPLEQYTPIGVVVVPASHTDDGTARVMSLASMDYNNPDNGNNTDHIRIVFGGDGYDIENLNNKEALPCIANNITQIISEEQTIQTWLYGEKDCYLASDLFNTYPNPYDEGTYYTTGTTIGTYPAAPSPYLNDGSKNSIYHSYNDRGNALADINGKGNTENIIALDNTYSTDWQTANTIQSSVSNQNQYIHPAAQCCWRYHTVGTNQGDWYLPAAGELGYLISRFKIITDSIKKINDLGFIALSLALGGSYHSSTEYNSKYTYGMYITTFNAKIGSWNSYKFGNSFTRAFCKI